MYISGHAEIPVIRFTPRLPRPPAQCPLPNPVSPTPTDRRAILDDLQAVPALIAAAKSAFANPGVDHQGLASSGAGGEPSERSREGGPLSQGDVPARSWRLREAALLG